MKMLLNYAYQFLIQHKGRSGRRVAWIADSDFTGLDVLCKIIAIEPRLGQWNFLLSYKTQLSITDRRGWVFQGDPHIIPR